MYVQELEVIYSSISTYSKLTCSTRDHDSLNNVFKIFRALPHSPGLSWSWPQELPQVLEAREPPGCIIFHYVDH